MPPIRCFWTKKVANFFGQFHPPPLFFSAASCTRQPSTSTISKFGAVLVLSRKWRVLSNRVLSLLPRQFRYFNGPSLSHVTHVFYRFHCAPWVGVGHWFFLCVFLFSRAPQRTTRTCSTILIIIIIIVVVVVVVVVVHMSFRCLLTWSTPTAASPRLSRPASDSHPKFSEIHCNDYATYETQHSGEKPYTCAVCGNCLTPMTLDCTDSVIGAFELKIFSRPITRWDMHARLRSVRVLFFVYMYGGPEKGRFWCDASVRRRVQEIYLDDVYLVTAFVPSLTACLASSPGSRRRTAVWISRLVIVERRL